MIQWSLHAHGRASDQTAEDLKEFFEGRLRFLFEEMGFAYDCINAVLAAGFDDPLDALERLRALQELRQEPDFLSLASNFKRMVNILSQAGSDGGDLEESCSRIRRSWLCGRSYLQVQPEVEAARKNHDYGAALRALASMRDVVDEFFKAVMVMAEDAAIRKNRISLLYCISQAFPQYRGYFQDRHRKRRLINFCRIHCVACFEIVRALPFCDRKASIISKFLI